MNTVIVVVVSVVRVNCCIPICESTVIPLWAVTAVCRLMFIGSNGVSIRK